MNTPVLETERLLLRPFCMDDARNVFECWESDPEVARYMFWCSHNDIEKTKKWVTHELEQISSDQWFRWAVVIKHSKELIGTGLVYYQEEYNRYEIGYNFGDTLFMIRFLLFFILSECKQMKRVELL